MDDHAERVIVSTDGKRLTVPLSLILTPVPPPVDLNSNRPVDRRQPRPRFKTRKRKSR